MENNKKKNKLWWVLAVLAVCLVAGIIRSTEKDDDEWDKLTTKALEARIAALETKQFENLQVMRIHKMEQEIDMLSTRLDLLEEDMNERLKK